MARGKYRCVLSTTARARLGIRSSGLECLCNEFILPRTNGSARIVWSIREAAYRRKGMGYHLHSMIYGFQSLCLGWVTAVAMEQEGSGQESTSDYRLSASIDHALHNSAAYIFANYLLLLSVLLVVVLLFYGMLGAACFWERGAYLGIGRWERDTASDGLGW